MESRKPTFEQINKIVEDANIKKLLGEDSAARIAEQMHAFDEWEMLSAAISPEELNGQMEQFRQLEFERMFDISPEANFPMINKVEKERQEAKAARDIIERPIRLVVMGPHKTGFISAIGGFDGDEATSWLNCSDAKPTHRLHMVAVNDSIIEIADQCCSKCNFDVDLIVFVCNARRDLTPEHIEQIRDGANRMQRGADFVVIGCGVDESSGIEHYRARLRNALIQAKVDRAAQLPKYPVALASFDQILLAKYIRRSEVAGAIKISRWEANHLFETAKQFGADVPTLPADDPVDKLYEVDFANLRLAGFDSRGGDWDNFFRNNLALADLMQLRLMKIIRHDLRGLRRTELPGNFEYQQEMVRLAGSMGDKTAIRFAAALMAGNSYLDSRRGRIGDIVALVMKFPKHIRLEAVKQIAGDKSLDHTRLGAYTVVCVIDIDDLPPALFVDIVSRPMYANSVFVRRDTWNCVAGYHKHDKTFPNPAISRLMQSKYAPMVLCAYMSRDELAQPDIRERIIDTFVEWGRSDLATSFNVRLTSGRDFMSARRWFEPVREKLLMANLFRPLNRQLTAVNQSAKISDELKRNIDKASLYARP